MHVHYIADVSKVFGLNCFLIFRFQFLLIDPSVFCFFLMFLCRTFVQRYRIKSEIKYKLNRQIRILFDASFLYTNSLYDFMTVSISVK